MAQVKERPKPFLLPQYCKGCGRCIEACNKDCIQFAGEINPATGLVPVVIDWEKCTRCGLCILACPEPYGLVGVSDEQFELQDPAKLFGEKNVDLPEAEEIPGEEIPLPAVEPIVTKGNYASTLGALLAGCRHFYGYPITPSTEGAELAAKLFPEMDGVFLQAVSEVATVNIMYGTGGAGLGSLTFTSSPGFSLMLEGISYMIGAQVPAVFVNVMRGGPGLGNIAPEQSDIKLACHGLGHGNTRAINLMPSTVQEMMDFTILAFELAFKYRNPVIILSDGYLGQMNGKLQLPKTLKKPGMPKWAVSGDKAHRANLISSIFLQEQDLEKHNLFLFEKYKEMEKEARAELFMCEDAEIVLVASNTPSRMAKGAVGELRRKGVKAGLFRPITAWPFPIDAFLPLLSNMKRLVMVEANDGQLENELRLALSKKGVKEIPVMENIRRCGGMFPSQEEIVRGIMG